MTTLVQGRVLSTRMLAGTSLLLMTLAAVSFVRVWPLGLGLFIGGALTLARALHLTPPVDDTHPQGRLPLAYYEPQHIAFAIFGALALAATTALQLTRVTQHVQFALFVAGIAALTVGLGGGAHRREAERAPRAHNTTFTLIAVLAVAFGLRAGLLGTLVRITVDEMQTITPLLALDAAPTPLLSQMDDHYYPYSWLYPYLQQAGVTLAGHNLLGLRLMSAVYGTLTVGALYWLVRTVHNHRTALIAAILLAAYPFHIHFSRLAIPNSVDPLFGTLALACLANGLRGGPRLYWTAAGAMLGLTHYFFEGARLFFTPLALMWVMLAWATHDAPPRVWRNTAFMLFTAACVAAPMYITWAATDAVLFGRMADSGIIGAIETDFYPSLFARLAGSFALYVTVPDGSVFYGGTGPIVPMIAVPALLTGLVVPFYRRDSLLPLVWLLSLVTATGLLMWHSTHAARHIAAASAVAWLMALGISETVRLLTRERWPSSATAIVLAAGMLLYYGGWHLPYHNAQVRVVRAYHDVDDAVLRALELPPNTYVHIISTTLLNKGHPLDFAAFLTNGEPPPMRVWMTDEITRATFGDLPRNVNHAVFVEPGDARTHGWLGEAFGALPPPQMSDHAAVPLGKQFALYWFPAQ